MLDSIFFKHEFVTEHKFYLSQVGNRLREFPTAMPPQNSSGMEIIMAYSIIVRGADGPTSVFLAGKTVYSWFNLFGLILMIFIMIPNIVFALKCKDGFDNTWQNRLVETLEQIGRFGCLGLMVINIPGTYSGFISVTTYLLYILIDLILVFLYCLIWIIYFRKNNIFRALALSILPAMLFLYSGIMSRSILLIISAIIFAPCHIILSYKNAVCSLKNK